VLDLQEPYILGTIVCLWNRVDAARNPDIVRIATMSVFGEHVLQILRARADEDHFAHHFD